MDLKILSRVLFKVAQFANPVNTNSQIPESKSDPFILMGIRSFPLKSIDSDTYFFTRKSVSRFELGIIHIKNKKSPSEKLRQRSAVMIEK
jgi:hypothetical protein